MKTMKEFVHYEECPECGASPVEFLKERAKQMPDLEDEEIGFE